MKEVDIPVILSDEKSKPHYGSHGAAGADLMANIAESKWIGAGETALIPTGIKAELPEGYEIQIRPRSGLALKHGITVLNTPGTIDCDYRGEIQVILINHSKQPFEVTPKMRIAQAVVTTYTKANFMDSETLTTTGRGAGGFGHTGSH